MRLLFSSILRQIYLKFYLTRERSPKYLKNWRNTLRKRAGSVSLRSGSGQIGADQTREGAISGLQGGPGPTGPRYKFRQSGPQTAQTLLTLKTD